MPTLERATKFNPMYESDPVTAQYYRRYDDNVPQYYHRCDPDHPHYSSSVSASGSRDLGSDEIEHIYQNTTLTKEVPKPSSMFSSSSEIKLTLSMEVYLFCVK